jgi:hypothetical protein
MAGDRCKDDDEGGVEDDSEGGAEEEEQGEGEEGEGEHEARGRQRCDSSRINLPLMMGLYMTRA